MHPQLFDNTIRQLVTANFEEWDPTNGVKPIEEWWETWPEDRVPAKYAFAKELTGLSLHYGEWEKNLAVVVGEACEYFKEMLLQAIRLQTQPEGIDVAYMHFIEDAFAIDKVTKHGWPRIHLYTWYKPQNHSYHFTIWTTIQIVAANRLEGGFLEGTIAEHDVIPHQGTSVSRGNDPPYDPPGRAPPLKELPANRGPKALPGPFQERD